MFAPQTVSCHEEFRLHRSSAGRCSRATRYKLRLRLTRGRIAAAMSSVRRLNTVVLPLAGVFSKHDGPGRHVVGTRAMPSWSQPTRHTASVFPAVLATGRSSCGSTTPWRQSISIVGEAVSRCGRTPCCQWHAPVTAALLRLFVSANERLIVIHVLRYRLEFGEI